MLMMLLTGNKTKEPKNLGTPYSCIQYQIYTEKQVKENENEVRRRITTSLYTEYRPYNLWKKKHTLDLRNSTEKTEN